MATGYWTDRGHQEMMDVFFRGATAPDNFLVALVNDTVVGTDDWSDVSANQQTGTGYSQQTILRDATASGWPTLALDDLEMQITGKEVTFAATAANWIATTAVCIIANLATDRLLAYANIASITLGNGESYSVTPKLKLTKAT